MSETFDFFDPSAQHIKRAHRRIVEGTLDDADDFFWASTWHHIASAKVSLEAKIATYWKLRHRGVANINNCYPTGLYYLVLVDRHFVGALDLNMVNIHCYRLCIMWIDDDVEALIAYHQQLAEDHTPLQRKLNLPDDHYASVNHGLQEVLMMINRPRCMRFHLQEGSFREAAMCQQLSPLVQRLVEELVQPGDRLSREHLLVYGQSVKLIGMCVNDEELVAAWLMSAQTHHYASRRYMSIMFARKLYALATPDQRAMIADEVWHEIAEGGSNEGCFELAWLLGLVGPFDPIVQAWFLKNNAGLFPALTFAMIVALCDGYLETMHEITVSQKRFFKFVVRLPMDLQALVSLRLWGHTPTVIRGENFDRAFLVVI